MGSSQRRCQAALLAGLLVLAVDANLRGGEQDADLLVAMNGSGAVERYDSSGKHVGTFVRGLQKPNGIAIGPDGDLYVTTGAIGGPGGVVRVDGRTGRPLRALINVPEGEPGELRRATSIAWHGDDALVVSCDSGQVMRYDAGTGAFRGELGNGSKGGLTQAAAREGKVYVADWHEAGIRKFDLASGKDEGFAVRREGFHPWGVAFDSEGRLYLSGDANEVRRFDGKTDTALAAAPDVSTPVQVAIGPDGLLYVANLGADNVTIFDVTSGKLVRTIAGPEMRDPIGLAFTSAPRPIRLEPLTLESSAGDGRKSLIADAPPVPADARPVVRLLADAAFAELPFLGVDTERGDRVKHNLLRAPMRLVLRNRDARTTTDAATLPCTVEHEQDTVRYRITVDAETTLTWEIKTAGGQWRMRLSGEGAGLQQIEGADVVLPLDPRTCSTSIVAGRWSKAGRFSLPAVLSAPDLGQFHVTSDGGGRVEGSFVGERPGWMDLTLHMPSLDKGPVSLNFAPLVLPTPEGVDPALWRQARRGWFNLFQLSAQWRYPQAAGGAAAPAGIIANNVLSDPVSSLLWFHGDQALLIPELAPGVRATDILRRAIEYWLHDAIEPDGQVWYVSSQKHQMMDANPAVLIAAWCYVEATGDVAWAREHLPRLELVADYLARRDIDGDGLCESVQSGNVGLKTFGDTSIDTISSGHKNAWVNALVYRAWRCLADIEDKLDRPEPAQRYAALAAKLRAAYAPTFLNPQTGLLAWWRSADGHLHDYASVVTATYAVEYGLLDDAQSRALMDALWKKIEASGYRRFDLGLPINLEPVLRDAQYSTFGGTKEDGSDTFQHYCNGGVFPQFAINAMTALWRVGENERAEQLLRAMLERQDVGVFPNGGGFQCGITNVMNTGPEIYDWNGATTGYEGHCVRDCSFVMGVFLRDPAVREKIYRPLQ